MASYYMPFNAETNNTMNKCNNNNLKNVHKIRQTTSIKIKEQSGINGTPYYYTKADATLHITLQNVLFFLMFG